MSDCAPFRLETIKDMHLSTHKLLEVASLGSVEANSPEAVVVSGLGSVDEAKLAVLVTQVEVSLTAGGLDENEWLTATGVLLDDAPLLTALVVVGESKSAVGMAESQVSLASPAVDEEVGGAIDMVGWLDGPDLAVSAEWAHTDIAVGVANDGPAKETRVAVAWVKNNEVVKESLSHLFFIYNNP